MTMSTHQKERYASYHELATLELSCSCGTATDLILEKVFVELEVMYFHCQSCKQYLELKYIHALTFKGGD